MRPLFSLLLLTITATDVLAESSEFNQYFDYSRFIGRITDYDKHREIFKVYSKNEYIRFFRSGDKVKFKLSAPNGQYCQASIRKTHGEDYITISSYDLSLCMENPHNLRRGARFLFQSEHLFKRVYNASIHRKVLLKRRQKLLEQFNEINGFLWSYNQQRIKTTAKYEGKIIKIKKAKKRELDTLKEKKKDGLLLQKELNRRLSETDRDLKFYSINDMANWDVWHQDQNLGLPISGHPPE